MKPFVKRILFALIMVAAAATLFLLRSPAQVASLIDRVRGMGATGALVYALIYIVGTPLMLPATLLSGVGAMALACRGRSAVAQVPVADA